VTRKQWITRPRLAAFDYTGQHVSHVTIATGQRAPVLTGEIATQVIGSLARASESAGFDVLVVTLMPDHIHLLVAGRTPDSNLIRFVQRFKQMSGHAYAERGAGRLWQPSFHDRVLRRTEDVDAVARYIVGNPVRAGLIERGEDWPYSGGTLLDEVDPVQGERERRS
jgi:REP element-mobilizing transposase RayT